MSNSDSIRYFNDEARRHMNCTFVLTQGVRALGDDECLAIIRLVRDAPDDSFTPDNDPYGEHDFGSIEYGGEKIFWKIDYYDSPACEAGSEDPADPAKCHRVLTIMLAEEY